MITGINIHHNDDILGYAELPVGDMRICPPFHLIAYGITCGKGV